MRKTEVTIGGVYIAKVSGRLTQIRLLSESRFGGWDAVSLTSLRAIRIRTAARLRRPVYPTVAVQP